MTIATENSKIKYTANGATTAFNFPYHLQRKDDMEVYLDGTLSAAYTISGSAPFPSGVDIDMNTAPADGVVVLLIRKTDATQPFNLNNIGNFDQESIEAALDNVTLVAQDAYGKVLQAIEDGEESLTAISVAENAAAALASEIAAAASESAAATSASTASTAASTATAQANIATAQAILAAASQAAAALSAGSASGIANGSFYTYVVSSGTVTAVDAGAYSFVASGQIDLPSPGAAKHIRVLVANDAATITYTRNGSETINGIADDVTVTGAGFYTVSCYDSVNWLITIGEATGIYAQAQAGADGADGLNGDMTGPVSSTDNALVRFDGTDGSTVQNSEIIIDDSNNISGVGTLNSRNLATDASKLDGIEAGADVTDTANVTSSISGASLTSTTVATDDKVLIQDTSNSNAFRTVTAQSIADLASSGITTYKSTADQTGLDHTVEYTVTNLTFTPAANTTYLLRANIAWTNSAPTTNGCYLGWGSITGLAIIYFNGVVSSSENGSTWTTQAIDDLNRNRLFTASNANNNFAQATLMFRTGASPSGALNFIARAENSSGTLTVRAGSSMTVEIVG